MSGPDECWWVFCVADSPGREKGVCLGWEEDGIFGPEEEQRSAVSDGASRAFSYCLRIDTCTTSSPLRIRSWPSWVAAASYESGPQRDLSRLLACLPCLGSVSPRRLEHPQLCFTPQIHKINSINSHHTDNPPSCRASPPCPSPPSCTPSVNPAISDKIPARDRPPPTIARWGCPAGSGVAGSAPALAPKLGFPFVPSAAPPAAIGRRVLAGANNDSSSPILGPSLTHSLEGRYPFAGLFLSRRVDAHPLLSQAHDLQLNNFNSHPNTNASHPPKPTT